MKQVLWTLAKRLATDPKARAEAGRIYRHFRPKLEEAGRTVVEAARQADPRTQPREFGRRLKEGFERRGKPDRTAD